MAARRGSVDAVKRLVKAGAKVDSKNDDGVSTVHQEVSTYS